MPYDVSATGFSLTLHATYTFPASVQLTAFADDADPFDLPVAEAAQVGMDVNGNLVSWSAPQPQQVVVNVLPDSEEDYALGVLLEANMAKRGRRPIGDLITLVASYGNGATVTARNGKILSGPRGSGIATAGRVKSKQYTFAFQDFDMTRVRN